MVQQQNILILTLIILGDINGFKIDEIITLYSKPVMTNITENPKGILILVYKDTISVDLDIRESISQEDFGELQSSFKI